MILLEIAVRVGTLHLELLKSLCYLVLCQVTLSRLVIDYAVPRYLLLLLLRFVEFREHTASVLDLEIVRVEDAAKAVRHVLKALVRKLAQNELEYLYDHIHFFGHIVQLLRQVLVLLFEHLDVLH